MKNKIFRSIMLLPLFVGILAFVSCKKTYQIPTNTNKVTEEIKIYPDYKNIVIPSNIAPLNFQVKKTGKSFVARILGEDGKDLVSGSDEQGIIKFPLEAWRNFIQTHIGQSVKVSVYVQAEKEWQEYPSFSIAIATDTIDPYLSYRLIEPGYICYHQLGLYQRDMTCYDVRTIVENPYDIHEKDSYCINCHNYQNYSTQRMLFHVRSEKGGTVIYDNGKMEKINPKNDSILGNAVYPSWHPTLKALIFSSNETGQFFHLANKQKIEVFDTESDLIYYNAETHEISNVLKTPYELETFPTWAPTGDKIFYCVADLSYMAEEMKANGNAPSIHSYDKIRYNIKSLTFNPSTCTFGSPQTEVDCESMSKSASVPRVSPDGKYLLFTLGDYGQFHIWHKSADLYVKNLQTGQVYPLKAANSSNVDSYHTWSSNGRWIAFSSRRDDGSFTRIYICYFDQQGKAHKAFMLPQEDPTYSAKLFKSFNVPELTRDVIKVNPNQSAEMAKKIAKPVSYKEIRTEYLN